MSPRRGEPPLSREISKSVDASQPMHRLSDTACLGDVKLRARTKPGSDVHGESGASVSLALHSWLPQVVIFRGRTWEALFLNPARGRGNVKLAQELMWSYVVSPHSTPPNHLLAFKCRLQEPTDLLLHDEGAAVHARLHVHNTAIDL